MMIAADMQTRLREEMDRPPFNRWLAPTAVAFDSAARSIEIYLPFRPEFSHDPARTCFHGGVLAALADIAGHAVVAVFHGAPTPTISLQLDYLEPATGDGVHARGILRKLGRGISRADVELRCGDRLVAIARGAFNSRERSS
jgi:uncharacterized protein (TIGR00369 family)